MINDDNSPRQKNLPKAIKSREAYELLIKDPENCFLLDVRTAPEYEQIGHPDVPGGAHNIPLFFHPDFRENENFVSEVEERVGKETSILVICKSGVRAKNAALLLTGAGFKKLYFITDSFEGEADSNGLRTINGWKNEGLPYTHNPDERYVYKRRQR